MKPDNFMKIDAVIESLTDYWTTSRTTPRHADPAGSSDAASNEGRPPAGRTV